MLDILDLYKSLPDTRWDNKSLSYDKEEHDWSEFFLESVRELKPALDKLENIHLHFKTTELITLRKHLEKLTRSKEFSSRLDRFFKEYITPQLDVEDYMIQSTCGIRIVVPDQEQLGRLLSFHTGYWTGYSNSMGTVWIPLTEAYDSNSMQVVSWNDSIEIMEKIHREKLSLDDIQSLCLDKSYPVNLSVGECWLFNQGHLHGNINNTTGITRVSFDARYALLDGEFGPRRAGSFYRYPGTFHDIDKNKIKKGLWVVFVDQNSDYIGETPHYMIREFLLNFAKGLSIEISEWSNEYWYCTWMPKFRDFVNKDTLSGIILPSIHAFSCDYELRLELFETSIKNGQQLIFADENLLIKTQSDLENVEKIYREAIKNID